MKHLLEIAVLSAVAGACVAVGAYTVAKSRRDPAERERRRRALIEERGRLIEGTVSDYADGIVYYTYSWRGVEYEAAQDLRPLNGLAAANPDAVIGAVSVRFLPGDPSNSIVCGETWSGFDRPRTLSRT
jgi:hypothetical protein